MWRSLIAVTAIYGFGHPSLDGYRPGLLDRPLQAFYNDVNQAARDGQKALATLDDTRAVRHLRRYIASLDARLRKPPDEPAQQ
jgi:hypothetical protein